MWKVSNETNKGKLDLFRKEIIDVFWKILLERVQKKGNNKVCESFILKSKEITSLKLSKLFIKKVLQRKIDKESLLKIMTVVVEKYSYKEILEEFNNYISQNKQIDLLDFNVIEIKSIDEMKKIFKDFFYTFFFADERIWNYIDGTNFTRDNFHMNFLKENNKSSCPYCDAETIRLNGNRDIEHFIPKSKFPYLSMNNYNLAPSCGSCNGVGTGKGNKIKTPIVQCH